MKHVSLITNIFNCKANALLSDFKNLSSTLKIRLLNIYCSSFYGIQLININDSVLHRIEVSWRKALRKACFLPYRTHNVLLPLICNNVPLRVVIMKRIAKFYRTCLSSSNVSLNFVFRNSTQQMYSTTCDNMKYIAKYMGCTVNDILQSSCIVESQIVDRYYSSIKEQDKSIASVISECMDARDGVCSMPLDRDEYIELMSSLCIYLEFLLNVKYDDLLPDRFGYVHYKIGRAHV